MTLPGERLPKPRGGGVRDHRFGSSTLYSLGVEEELMLIDPHSWNLAGAIDTLLDASIDGPFASQLASELLRPVIETTTTICATVAEVDQQLRALRSRVGALSAASGFTFASAGAHPFALFEEQAITDRDRYRAMVESYQLVARQQLIYGLHLHAGLDDADRAIGVVENLVAHVPEFLALSASSPLWRGAPTGLASYRQVIFATLPRTGLPPRFERYDEYAETIGALERAGAIADYTSIWWDVRLHPNLGTVELRICDAVSQIEDAVSLAAYFQALVKHLAEKPGTPDPPGVGERMIAGENKWLAARYGLDASLIDPTHPTGARIPLRGVVARTLGKVRPHARELGCERELEGIEAILSRGNGAQTQMRQWLRGATATEISRELSRASAPVSATTGEATATPATSSSPPSVGDRR